MPHRRRTRSVQSYLPGYANAHPHVTCFLGSIRIHNPNSISIGSAIIAQLTAECRRAYTGMSFP